MCVRVGHRRDSLQGAGGRLEQVIGRIQPGDRQHLLHPLRRSHDSNRAGPLVDFPQHPQPGGAHVGHARHIEKQVVPPVVELVLDHLAKAPGGHTVEVPVDLHQTGRSDP